MCKMYEDINFKSPRNWGNFYFKEFIKDYVIKKLFNKKPRKYIHLSFTNLCNFKCRMCEPERSSSWVKEAEELFNKKIDVNFFNISKQEKEKFFNEIKNELKNAKLIHMSSSGEPFLTDENLEMLDFLIANNITDVHLLYNSNMSIRYHNNVDLYEKLSHFKKVIVLMSIDGTELKNQYIRGYKNNNLWSIIIKNIENLKAKIPGLELHLYSSVSALNAYHITDLHKEFYNKGYIKANRFRLNPVFKDYHTAQLLPVYFKIEISKKIKRHIEWLASIKEPEITNFYNDKSINEYKNFLKYLFKEDKSNQLNEFLEFNKKLDISRNTSLYEAFPELNILK